jgi:hypothetical protein
VVNPCPNAEELANIAVATAETARKLCGISEPRVALLSFSTKGSANHALVDKVREATEIARALAPDTLIDGELQFDAALVPEVGALKAPGSRHAVIRRHFNGVKTSIGMDTLPKVMKLRFPDVKYTYNKSENFFSFSNGSEIWLAGLDDAQ